MPRATGTTLGDLVGKLTVLRVECSKCGRYPLQRLIEQRGRDVREDADNIMALSLKE